MTSDAQSNLESAMFAVAVALACSVNACSSRPVPPPSPLDAEQARRQFLLDLEHDVQEQPVAGDFVQERLKEGLETLKGRSTKTECHAHACILDLSFPSRQSFDKFFLTLVEGSTTENYRAWKGAVATLRVDVADGGSVNARLLLGREP